MSSACVDAWHVLVLHVPISSISQLEFCFVDHPCSLHFLFSKTSSFCILFPEHHQFIFLCVCVSNDQSESSAIHSDWKCVLVCVCVRSRSCTCGLVYVCVSSPRPSAVPAASTPRSRARRDSDSSHSWVRCRVERLSRSPRSCQWTWGRGAGCRLRWPGGVGAPGPHNNFPQNLLLEESGREGRPLTDYLERTPDSNRTKMNNVSIYFILLLSGLGRVSDTCIYDCMENTKGNFVICIWW